MCPRHDQRLDLCAHGDGMNFPRERFHFVRSDDAVIAKPHIGDIVPPFGRIDDAATFDPRQHGHAPTDGSAAAICAMASATEGLALCCEAATATSVPVAGHCSTAS